MDAQLVYLFIVLLTIGLCWSIAFVFFRKNLIEPGGGGDEDKGVEDSSRNGKGSKGKAAASTTDKKTVKGKGKASQNRTISASESESHEIHPWFASTLKGHSMNVTCLNWSSNDKFLASCALDRTVHIWLVKDLTAKDHKSIRVNIPFDSATLLRWSPDSKAFIVSKEEGQIIEVFKLGKKADGSVGNITSACAFKKVHNTKIVGIGIACTGNFIMSCSSDGTMTLWNLKGSVLEEINVPGGTVYAAKVSPCGRYVAACGHSREVLIYEVLFSEQKEFVGVKIWGTLKEHETGVCDLDFNADSSRIATVTKYGTWRLFDTTGNRVNLICQGIVGEIHVSEEKLAVIAMSPDGRIVAVGHDNQVDLFIAKIGASGPITGCWNIPSANVKTITFSSDDKYLITGGDKVIRVYHNVCGYHAKINDLKLRIQDNSTGAAMKSRLAKEVDSIMKDMESLSLNTNK